MLARYNRGNYEDQLMYTESERVWSKYSIHEFEVSSLCHKVHKILSAFSEAQRSWDKF